MRINVYYSWLRIFDCDEQTRGYPFCQKLEGVVSGVVHTITNPQKFFIPKKFYIKISLPFHFYLKIPYLYIMIEEAKQQIRNNIKWSTDRPLGGQQVGLCRSTVVLFSEDLDIKISIGYYRSSLKNKELAMTLFELTLDEIVK